MSFEINCPTGLRFSARAMQVRELRELAEAAEKNAADGGLTALLAACWQELLDPGPAYPTLQAGTRPDWNRIADGDVTAALLRLRVATLGPIYPFIARCENCRRKQPDPLTVNLGDWEERPYPEATIASLASGTPIETKLTNGSSVKWKPAVIGQHAKLVASKRRWQKRLQEKKDPRAATALRRQDWDMLVQQVEWVETLGERSRDPIALIEWADALELGEFFHLRDELDAATGGVDTKTAFTCAFTNCEWQQERDVPFGGDFFRPPPKGWGKKEEEVEQNKTDQPIA